MDFSKLPQYPGEGYDAYVTTGGSSAEVVRHVERYRELRTSGCDRDVALGVLRQSGASFLFCMKAIYDVDGLRLDECKKAVHHSPAWSDEFDDREAFWDEVARQLRIEMDAQRDSNDESG
jgi:hypothetical protein